MNPPDQLLEDVAGRDKPGLATSLKTYLLRHAQVFFYSLGQLSKTPLSMLMTAAVIGIALALPTGLHVMLDNAQRLSGGWDRAAKISLYLKKGTNEEEARQLANTISRMDEVIEVDYISSEKGLKEFRERTGYKAVLQALDDNPIPATLVATPSLQYNSVEQLEQLAHKLETYQAVDLVQLDSAWVQRLFAIMDIVRKGVVILGIILSVGVLLVVGNTIRLAIQNRRDEIVIVKLIGGTDAFIRRPFLYTGFWYGFFGGLIAITLVYFSLLLMSDPVEKLSGLYQAQFALHKMDLETILIILSLSIGLSLAGSWVAVGRHLKEIEPH